MSFSNLQVNDFLTFHFLTPCNPNQCYFLTLCTKVLFIITYLVVVLDDLQNLDVFLVHDNDVDSSRHHHDHRPQ